ncbi:MAG: archaellin/type IV pilin N-terminal domain-containing protein [Candidatus Bathyarchaeia archaeon]
MNPKTLLKSRKGISPILATLLLIVIAVAAIVVTYAWIMTYMSSAGHQAGVQLALDTVSWPNNTIKLYIRNVGTSDAIIDEVYIGTSAANLDPASHDGKNKAVLADGGTLVITINYSWTNGTTYYFKVVPKTGAPLEFSRRAP